MSTSAARTLSTFDASHAQPERRRCTRTKVLSSELVVVTLGVQTGVLLDLSTSGFAIQAVFSTKPGNNLPVQFRLPYHDELFKASCEVVWVDNRLQTGLKFVELADTQKTPLERWAATHSKTRTTPPHAENLRVVSQANPASKENPSLTRTAIDHGPAVTPAIGNQTEALVADEMFRADTEISALDQEIFYRGDLPIADLLQRVVGMACRLTCADGAAIALRDEEGILCRASTGDAPDLGSRVRSGSGFTGECFRTGQVVLCNDVEKDVRRPTSAALLNLRSILIVPIELRGSVLGAVEVLSPQRSAFNEAHVAELQAIAKLLAFVFESAPAVLVQQRFVPEAVNQVCAAAIIATDVPNQANVKVLEVVSRTLHGAIAMAKSRWKRGYNLVGAAGITATDVPNQAKVKLLEVVSRTLHGAIAMAKRRWKQGSNLVGAAGITATDVPNQANVKLLEVVSRTLHGAIATAKSRWKRGSKTMPYALTASVTVLLVVAWALLTAVRVSTGVAEKAAVSQKASLSEHPQPAMPSAGNVESQAAESSVAQHISRVIRAKGEKVVSRPKQPQPVFAANTRKISSKEISVVSTEAIAPPAFDSQSIPEEKMPVAAFFLPSPPPGPPPVLSKLVMGRAISQPPPIFPAAARQMGMRGSVTLNAVIGADGKLKNLRVTHGNPLLTPAALEAVKKWRYEPSYLNGSPVEVGTTITVKFQPGR